MIFSINKENIMPKQAVDLFNCRFGKWLVLHRAKPDIHHRILWTCLCDCGTVTDVLGQSLTHGTSKQCLSCSRVGNKYGKGRLIGSHSEAEKAALVARNNARKGIPVTSEKALAAVRAACKKMNEVRHNQAKHILADIDAERLTAVCTVCGQVPIKVIKHTADKWNHLRDQYSCWVGTRCREADGEAARVSYPHQALDMWNTQKGDCAICGKSMVRAGNTSDGATLDHCHRTGYIRGYLHQGCNKGLGHFQDDPEILKKAAEYLLRAAED
jgi:hypothetical protein